MLKNRLLGLAACACLLAAGPVAAGEIDFDQGFDLKRLVESLKAKAARETAGDKSRAASWTIMAYINAKNNLEKYALLNVNQMEMVGSSDKVKIAVELGRMSRYDSSDGGWKGERRYILEKDGDPGHISSPVLQKMSKADMGDWRHLVDFVQWAQAQAPAQHYMLIVWNHGSGWTIQRQGEVVINGISYDDETGNHMSTLDLGRALASIGKIDVYASDACLMQMAEVDYQIKEHADYIVGSEETEADEGYTYNTFLGPIVARPSMSSADVAKLAVESYRSHYAQKGEGATQSAVRSEVLSRLPALLNGWTKAIMAADEAGVVKEARSKTLRFADSDNKDLLDFVELVDKASGSADVRRRGAELQNLLGEGIIANGATGTDYANAKGLAIYLPDSAYDSDYDSLAWAADAGWAKFVRWTLGRQASRE